MQITDRLSVIEHQNIQNLKLLVSQLSMLISLIQRVSKTDPSEAQKIFKQAAIEAIQPENLIKKMNDLAKK
ncbi:MAG: hypothetical protein HYR79_05495 [Nitrospirae bacterium]|nr:hypothetical protein [Nitrospirota bacterium]